MTVEDGSAAQVIALAGANDYGRLASVYDSLANLLSAGGIRAVKRAQLPDLEPGDHVLYAGAGGGEDAVMAARAGARVTVLDLSSKMLSRAERRFRRAGVHERIELVHGNVLRHHPAVPYDVVCANFFLSVFSPVVKREVLAHLAGVVRPGGKVLVADFAPPEGPFLLRLARQAYFGASVLSCWALAGNALHTLYDYRPDLEAVGLRLERTTPCGWFFATLTSRARGGEGA